MIEIPIKFFDSKYDSSKFPGSKDCNGIENGANCQYFAYELLRHFGYEVPNLRSSNLWEDTKNSQVVSSFEPLDVMFFGRDSDPYGAHIGVYIGADRILHLSKEVGYPTVWDLEEFRKRDSYKFLIGAKRLYRKHVKI